MLMFTSGMMGLTIGFMTYMFLADSHDPLDGMPRIMTIREWIKLRRAQNNLARRVAQLDASCVYCGRDYKYCEHTDLEAWCMDHGITDITGLQLCDHCGDICDADDVWWGMATAYCSELCASRERN